MPLLTRGSQMFACHPTVQNADANKCGRATKIQHTTHTEEKQTLSCTHARVCVRVRVSV